MILRRCLIFVAALLLNPALPDVSLAQNQEAKRSLQDITGKTFEYGIDFLFFDRVARGELILIETEEPNVYRAELLGQTLGIASWLTGDREQKYSSLMQLMPDGSLQTIEHVSKIKKKRWREWIHRSKTRRFDYKRRVVEEVKFKDSEVTDTVEHHIPEGVLPVDMLTAFYNLRLGVYGPLERGRIIFIPTFSGKGFAEIEVNILTVEEHKKLTYFPKQGLLVRAKIDPEIFDTKSGHLYVWFNSLGTPGMGIIEDMIGMGDVRGYLERVIQ